MLFIIYLSSLSIYHVIQSMIPRRNRGEKEGKLERKINQANRYLKS